jgi:hypothetical protein
MNHGNGRIDNRWIEKERYHYMILLNSIQSTLFNKTKSIDT